MKNPAPTSGLEHPLHLPLIPKLSKNGSIHRTELAKLLHSQIGKFLLEANLKECGAEGTGGVIIASSVGVPEVEALVRPCLASLIATFFVLAMLQ